MFDFAWTEIAVIGVVALIAIGPKDMPVAIKAVSQAIKKARRMASEFQVHVDEMVREADLHEVKTQFNDLRRMDIKSRILGAVDGDGSIRRTMNERLITPAPGTSQPDTSQPGTPMPDPVAVDSAATHTILAPAPDAPAFIPPQIARVDPPPAFVPPQTRLLHQRA